MDVNLQLLIELAKESELEDPIDWPSLGLTGDEAYFIIASQVLEMSKQFNETIMLSTIVKLLVENFVLHIKLLKLNGA